MWPLFGLRLRTERLELRSPDDATIAELAAVARRGVVGERTPFASDWTARPAETWEAGFAQYFWAQRGRLSPTSWSIPLAALLDGEPIGVQQVMADDFPLLRVFKSGSWIGREHQGRGLGTEMRAAVLELGFAGLGGEVAVSGAYAFNAASIRVSRKLGYEPNGTRLDRVRERAEEALLFRLTRAAWESSPRPAVEIEGLEECLPLLGLQAPGRG